jgi:hypothetical protein
MGNSDVLRARLPLKRGRNAKTPARCRGLLVIKSCLKYGVMPVKRPAHAVADTVTKPAAA